MCDEGAGLRYLRTLGRRINKIFLIEAVFIFGFLLYSNSALAQATYNSLVEIPGMGSNPTALKYLSTLYTFLISVVGIVAMGAIVIGGARYLTSVGNPSAIQDAKNTIYAAISGLLLALTSWVIISTINPDILLLKQPNVSFNGAAYMPIPPEPQCGSENSATGCTCTDGKVFNLKQTKINLTVASNPAITGANDTFSGKLTDINGIPINLANVKINIINSTLNASWTLPLITNITGDFTTTANFTCNTSTDNVSAQVVFAGDTTYFSVGSTVIPFSITGGSTCFVGNYLNSPAVTLWSGGCNAFCSDPASFHCGTVKLGVGTAEDIALAGDVQNINAYVDQLIYFNPLLSNSPIGKLGRVRVDLVPKMADYFGASVYDCDLSGTMACGGLGGCNFYDSGFGLPRSPDKAWDKNPALGRFSHIYPGALDRLPITLIASFVNPSGVPPCFDVKDKSVTITIP